MRAASQCWAPRSSDDLDDIARCNKITLADLKTRKGLLTNFITTINEKNVEIKNKKEGTMNIWNDAML